MNTNPKTPWNLILDKYLLSKKRLSKIQKSVFEFYRKSIVYNLASYSDSWYGHPKSKGSFGIYYGSILVSGTFTNIVEMIIDEDISGQIDLNTRPVKSSKTKNKPLLHWISTDIDDIERINNLDIIWKHYSKATAIINKYPNINKDSPIKTKNKLRFTELGLPSANNINLDLYNDIEQEGLAKLLQKDKYELIQEQLSNLKETDAEFVSYNTRLYKRDNKTIAQLKILRDYRCQICSTRILKSDGGFYVEGAHIKPKKMKGNELPHNILILCPNHHKEFDYGKKRIISHTKGYLEFELNDKYYKLDLKI